MGEKYIREYGCCDGWSSLASEVDGECPDCGMETVDGEAASGCFHSPVSCETCGHRSCDLFC